MFGLGASSQNERETSPSQTHLPLGEPPPAVSGADRSRIETSLTDSRTAERFAQTASQTAGAVADALCESKTAWRGESDLTSARGAVASRKVREDFRDHVRDDFPKGRLWGF